MGPYFHAFTRFCPPSPSLSQKSHPFRIPPPGGRRASWRLQPGNSGSLHIPSPHGRGQSSEPLGSRENPSRRPGQRKGRKNRKSVFSLTPPPHPRPNPSTSGPASGGSLRSLESSPRALAGLPARPATRAGWLTSRSPLTSAGAFSARLRTNWAMVLGRRARYPDWPAECHPPGRTCHRTPVRFQGQASPFRAGPRYLGVPLSFQHPVGQFLFFSHRGESGYEKMRSEST